MRLLLVCSVLVVGLASAKVSKIADLYKSWQDGEGTYYGIGGEKGGACQMTFEEAGANDAAYKKNFKHPVAMNKVDWFGSTTCGMCFKMKGTGEGSGINPIPKAEFLTYVADLCPGCKTGDLDLAANGDGRWHTKIKAVQCPVGNEKIAYKFVGSNPWYIKVQTRKERVPVTKFEIYQPKSKVWSTLKHSLDGHWLIDASQKWDKPFQSKLKVRLTSMMGKKIEEEISFGNNLYTKGQKQFPLDPSLPHA